jgi:hypothetical protein
LNTVAQCDCDALPRLDERGYFRLTNPLVYDTEMKSNKAMGALYYNQISLQEIHEQ